MPIECFSFKDQLKILNLIYVFVLICGLNVELIYCEKARHFLSTIFLSSCNILKNIFPDLQLQ